MRFLGGGGSPFFIRKLIFFFIYVHIFLITQPFSLGLITGTPAPRGDLAPCHISPMNEKSGGGEWWWKRRGGGKGRGWGKGGGEGSRFQYVVFANSGMCGYLENWEISDISDQPAPPPSTFPSTPSSHFRLLGPRKWKQREAGGGVYAEPERVYP